MEDTSLWSNNGGITQSAWLGHDLTKPKLLCQLAHMLGPAAIMHLSTTGGLVLTWYVLRGDWLWSGKGMMEAHTPRIMDG
jgi:hypothetical protein